jgi:hypothetical protein
MESASEKIYLYVPDTLWPMIDNINEATFGAGLQREHKMRYQNFARKKLSSAGLAPKFRPR